MKTYNRSLYDRLGGEPAIDALVTAFYDRVLADSELAPFFEHTSMERLRTMQRQFLAEALGGPNCHYSKSLAYAHQGRGITVQHFARFIQHFLETLREHGVSEEDADEVIAKLNTRVNEITGCSY